MKEKTILVGAHMSIAGGFSQAIERGLSIGCTCIQVFTKNNRQWNAKPLKKDETIAFYQAQKNNPAMRSVVAHASYLINIGSSKKEIKDKSVKSLIIELERCDALGIPFLVLHPGVAQENTQEKCIEQIASSVNNIFTEHSYKTKLLFENTAGQGNAVCYSFEQLALLLSKIKKKNKVGICFDTCHAFAAGYDFTTEKNYEHMWQEFDKIIGINTLHTIHMNDSKKTCGSRVDRHEHIGKGLIGLDAFRYIMNDKRFLNIPKILETPKDDDSLKNDKKNIDVLKSLVF